VSAALVLHDVVNRLKKSKVDWALSEQDLMDKRIDWAVKSLKSGPQVLEQLLKKGI